MTATTEPLIRWQDSFSVGVPAVDHEHREMVQLINSLYAQIGTADRYTVADFLGEVYTRISAHFALEEKIMRDRGYDGLAEHKADHERLLDDIVDIIDSYQDDGAFSAEDLNQRLAKWFSVHFSTLDARLHHKLG
ncbi:MAG: hemerythrin family protein [Gammaproteobacteria bacterium]|nr:hemerythrin family protein [Gammaproteobacteria bacterium]